MPTLSARSLTKYYAETRTLANDSVSLDLEKGELHAIVGENGAGKSTLARVIAGLERPDSGSIQVRGRKIRPGSVRAAEAAGIGFVPQMSLLAPDLSVAENLALGRETRSAGFFISSKRIYVEAALVMERYGFGVDPGSRVSSLSVAQRRQAEIARALARGGDILILDEPTSVLSETEADRLFDFLRGLADAGAAIAFVTHRVSELIERADRMTVLREGRVVASMPAPEADESLVAALMSRSRTALNSSCAAPSSVGDRVERQYPERKGLELKDIRVHPGAEPFSLRVVPGEILAVTAFAGNGLERLEAIASGMTESEEGAVLINGKDMGKIPRSRLRADELAYIPSDREGTGLCLGSKLRDNLLALRRGDYGKLDYLFSARRDVDADALAKDFGIKGGIKESASALSGGNRQKLLLARELERPKKALILAEPLQGLDLGSRRDAIDRIRCAADTGAAVLVLASSVEDAMDLADRVVAIYRGRATCDMSVAGKQGSAVAASILASMTGSSGME